MLAAAALLGAASAARVSSGEIAHYSMSYQDCDGYDGYSGYDEGIAKFTETVSDGVALTPPDDSAVYADYRALRKGAGASCQPEHLGAILNLSWPTTTTLADYKPLYSQTVGSAVANFSGGMTDGFSVELWVKPSPV